MSNLKDVEDKRALLRKTAEEFFEMSVDDIPPELYGAFMAGYAQAMEDCKETFDAETRRLQQ